MTKTAPQAAIYCRLSLARDGDTTKVDDQERICRELLHQLGWQLADGVGHPEPNGVFTDNNESAWQRNRKRPGWNKMLEAIGDGRIDGIVVYHGDRLVRHPWDLELLIDLSESRGIKLASPTGTRDLGNRDEHFALRIEVAVAKRSSDDTSRRAKMGHARRKREGRMVSGGRGGRLFGFATDGITHVPGEAAVVREVIGRVLAGEGIRHIARSLHLRGVTTTAGKPMHPLAVRRMIASPRYAGLMPDGETAAAWEPVIARDDWETANTLMAGNAFTLAPGHNARRYLLSGLARCGECGGPMQVLTGYTSKRTGQVVAARYGCLMLGCRKVYRNVAHLDAYVTRRTVSRLSHPLNLAARLPVSPGVVAEIQALTQERGELEALIADHTKGRVHLLLGRLDSLDARMAQLRELTAADAAAHLIDRYVGTSEDEFSGLPLATRRAIVAACYTITVLPASGRGPGFRPEDVRLTPAPGSVLR